jgi:hypothetical protein
MKLAFPAGVGSFTDQSGTLYLPDANGMVDIGTQSPDSFLNAGFTFPTNAGATAGRPATGLSPGLTYFDTSLNKPIWRNTANSGWVDATGAAV